VDKTERDTGGTEQPSDGAELSPPPPQVERARRGRPPPPPLRVRVELVLVDGEEGKYLRDRQAEAIREALRWFAEHPMSAYCLMYRGRYGWTYTTCRTPCRPFRLPSALARAPPWQDRRQISSQARRPSRFG
jgi:hypothetical protein